MNLKPLLKELGPTIGILALVGLAEALFEGALNLANPHDPARANWLVAIILAPLVEESGRWYIGYSARNAPAKAALRIFLYTALGIAIELFGGIPPLLRDLAHVPLTSTCLLLLIASLSKLIHIANGFIVYNSLCKSRSLNLVFIPIFVTLLLHSAVNFFWITYGHFILHYLLVALHVSLL